MSEINRLVMTVIAANTAGAHCGICGARVCFHTAEGVTELSRMVNDPPERAILRDLIAELRSSCHQVHNGLDAMQVVFDAEAIADRAEARLREVTGNE